MATDLKEYFPDKEVTVVQSRARVMPSFHPRLHEIIQERFDQLGIRLITESRVKIPPGGFPNTGTPFDVDLTNGSKVSAEFVILATGQTPNNQLVADLKPSTPGAPSIVNPDNGYIRVRPTMQFLDEKYGNMFAVGDIADTGAQKAARPGAAQAAVVAKNIVSLIEGETPQEKFVKGPGAIHITLGMVSELSYFLDCAVTPLWAAVANTFGFLAEIQYDFPQSESCGKSNRAVDFGKTRVSRHSPIALRDKFMLY